jgi:hypothetical protein
MASRKLSILTACLVSAGIVAIATPAYAGSSSTCATHYVCVWVDGDFNGGQWSASGYTSYVNAPSWMHDQGSSWANHNVSQRECIIDHVNGLVVILDRLPAGTNRPVVPSGTNDRIDAVEWC